MKIIKKFLSIFFIFSFFLYSNNSSTKSFALNVEEISSKSAILIDANTKKIIFEKDPKEKRPFASLAKLMMLLLAMEAIDEGKISATDMVTAGEGVSSKGGTHVWIKPGEQLTAEELIKAVAVASANDAAFVLAEKIAGSESDFVSQMMSKASEIGMKNTVFKNAIGEEQEGQVSTAYDLALLSAELIKFPEIFDYTSIWMDSIRDKKTQIVNANKMIKSYDGTNGLKTGTTMEAGSCAAISALRDNLNLISVVLGSENGISRFKDAEKLLDFGFANFSSVDPETPKNLTPIKVIGGINDTVDVKIEEGKNVLIPKGKEKAIEYKISLKESVKAPVEPGTNVGTITYKLKNDVLIECPVVVAQKVSELNFASSFSILFKAFLNM